MKKSKKILVEKLLFVIPISIILISFLIPLLKGQLNFGTVNFENLDGYGSFIGGLVGTFLTIIATYYIYKTYHSQKEELKKQKKQLKLQSQLIAQQQFESTFFNMLNVHRELKNDLELNSNIRICDVATYVEVIDKKEGLFKLPNTVTNEIETFYKGIKVFEFIREDFKVLFESFKDAETSISNGRQDFENILLDKTNEYLIENKDFLLQKNEKVIIDVIYFKIFDTYKNILNHYCRNVYHILKFIRESEEHNGNSYRKYADIFQSQLNVNEQFILFYNFIHFVDESKEIYSTINLANHYEFLENLGSDNLLDKELQNNKKFYNFQIK